VGTWKGNDLGGDWLATIKIDGVRAIWYPELGLEDHAFGWFSRADKPLYNLPHPDDMWFAGAGDQPWNCEVYLGSLKDTIRAVRTQHLKPDTPVVKAEHLYPLFPDADLDHRLIYGTLSDPSADQIGEALRIVNDMGYEGLVLRQGEVCLKVKPSDTWDVRVLSLHEGEGKHVGRLGYVRTVKGDVGGGWTDIERQTWWNQRVRMVGTTIEVAAMSLTPAGKFRHPRFIRERFDKVADE
jgi:hypothetical protein